ncbi:MAG: aldo/keto reductase [Bacteroidales bacterium]
MLKKTGFAQVSAIGLGTWEMGGRMEADFSRDTHWVEIIRKGIELGLTHIDTAEMYGNGHTEEIVGEAISDIQRDTLFITSKVWTTNLEHDKLLKACEKSLKRLRTDYLDLYLIHFPNPNIPLKESMKAMNRLVELKMVRQIGVSNFTRRELEEAVKYSSYPIVANQIEYSLLARNKGTYVDGAENKIIPYCQHNQITVIAWRPLGKEKFSLLSSHPLIIELSRKYDASAAQIALAWLIAQEGIITIPKTGNIQHLEENAAAMRLKLEKEDLDRLSKSFTA